MQLARMEWDNFVVASEHASSHRPSDDDRLLPDVGPTWLQLRWDISSEVDAFAAAIESHVLHSVLDVYKKVRSEIEVIFSAVSLTGAGKFEELLVESPSASKIEAVLFETASDNSPDRLSLMCDKVQELALVKEMLAAITDVKKPAELPNALGFTDKSDWPDAFQAFEKFIDRTKLFLCLGSAWDLMIDEEKVSRMQRKADQKSLQVKIGENCKATFPDMVSQLLQKWVDGADIVSLLP